MISGRMTWFSFMKTEEPECVDDGNKNTVQHNLNTMPQSWLEDYRVAKVGGDAG